VRWGTYQVGTRDGQTGFTIVYMYRTHHSYEKIGSDATAYVREMGHIKWDQDWQTGFSSLDTSNIAGWM